MSKFKFKFTFTFCLTFASMACSGFLSRQILTVPFEDKPEFCLTKIAVHSPHNNSSANFGHFYQVQWIILTSLKFDWLSNLKLKISDQLWAFGLLLSLLYPYHLIRCFFSTSCSVRNIEYHYLHVETGFPDSKTHEIFVLPSYNNTLNMILISDIPFGKIFYLHIVHIGHYLLFFPSCSYVDFTALYILIA